MGGKSKSSADTTSTTSTSTSSATGVVGDVLQGQNINITQEFPEAIQDIFGQLLDLTGQSIDIAAGAGQAALESTNALATKSQQPDLALIEGYQKQVYYAIGAVALVVVFAWVFKK